MVRNQQPQTSLMAGVCLAISQLEPLQVAVSLAPLPNLQTSSILTSSSALLRLQQEVVFLETQVCSVETRQLGQLAFSEAVAAFLEAPLLVVLSLVRQITYSVVVPPFLQTRTRTKRMEVETMMMEMMRTWAMVAEVLLPSSQSTRASVMPPSSHLS
jgi:hypothetical protein